MARPKIKKKKKRKRKKVKQRQNRKKEQGRKGQRKRDYPLGENVQSETIENLF